MTSRGSGGVQGQHKADGRITRSWTQAILCATQLCLDREILLDDRSPDSIHPQLNRGWPLRDGMDEPGADDGRLEPAAGVGRAIPEIVPFARAGSRESGATKYQGCGYD